MEITLLLTTSGADKASVYELCNELVQSNIPAEVIPPVALRVNVGASVGAAVGAAIDLGAAFGTILITGPLLGSAIGSILGAVATEGISSELIIKVGVPAVAAISGALATWLAKSGRKVVMQIRDGEQELKIEAETPEQAQQMIGMAEKYQKNLSARNTSAGK